MKSQFLAALQQVRDVSLQIGVAVLLHSCPIQLQSLESQNFVQLNWVGKCWLTITGALHDDLLVKVAHVQRGHIHSLLAEINAALLVNSAEDVQPLRLELYGATMQKDCNSDLQTYIAYLLQRSKKLAFHHKPVEDAELTSIFLKG